MGAWNAADAGMAAVKQYCELPQAEQKIPRKLQWGEGTAAEEKAVRTKQTGAGYGARRSRSVKHEASFSIMCSS